MARWKYLVFLALGISLFFVNRKRPIPTPEGRPNDWFQRQRAFPFEQINVKAYREALEKTRSLRAVKSKTAAVWQSLGPSNVVGRVTAIDMTADGKIYAGAASGGIWLSEDMGEHWAPIFDTVMAIGDVTIAPSNPEVIYAGTGEPNGGGGSLTYPGMGVYKSSDAGKSWFYAGLRDSSYIGKLAIHPTDPQTVYAAAMGNLFSTNQERGLYRSRDGGSSWQQVLFSSEGTGCVDVIINPKNPRMIYAAMWERIRHRDERTYGGPNSAIYRSLDGGDSWQELTQGLPEADMGRIGIALCAGSPEVVYAAYADTVGFFAGVFKSTDGGDTWTRTTDAALEGNYATFGWWFGKIRVHPEDPDYVIFPGFEVYFSRDGGRSWIEYAQFYLDSNNAPPEDLYDVHVDQHGLAFQPGNPRVMVLCNDGGVYVSDGPEMEWLEKPGAAIAQFYSCEISEAEPEKFFGGMQDNGTWSSLDGLPSNWQNLWGSDGMRVLVHPTEPERVYVSTQYGNVIHLVNGQYQDHTHGLFEDDRKNWNTPLVSDPSHPDTLYYGSQRVYKTTGSLLDLQPISDDLSNGPGAGGLVYGTLTTLNVSPVDSGIIYAGTDDGNVWITEDGGQAWRKISDNLPQRWVTRVTAHPVERLTAYVAFSGFRWDEYMPHLLETLDGGTTWRDISIGLPEAPVNDILVGPAPEHLLFAATDTGVFASADRGANWQVLGTGLPLVPVTDLDLHVGQNFLIAATFGRSMYRLDLAQVNLNASQGSQMAVIRYLPEIQVDAENATRFAVLNPGDTPTGLEVFAFDKFGTQLAHWTPGALAAHAHLWVRVAEAMPEAGDQVAWLQVGAEREIDVFAELQLPEARSAYPAARSLEQTTYLPHVARDTISFQTVLASVNGLQTGLEHGARSSFSASSWPIPEHRLPFGQAAYDLRSLFGFDLSRVNYARLEAAGAGAASMEYFVSLPERNQMAALGLDSKTASNLKFLHVAADRDSFWTGLVYLNAGTEPVQVSQHFYHQDGHLIETVTPPVLESEGKVILVFGETERTDVSWVEIRADGESLIGYELFGSNPESGENLFAGLGAVRAGGTTLDYAYAQVGSNAWTGLVAVNIGELVADLSFTAYDADGQSLETVTIPDVAPGAKISRAVANLFTDPETAPRTAWVRAVGSASSWAGFQLWSAENRYLSGINASIR